MSTGAWRLRAAFAVLVIAKLWLVGGQRLTAYGSLTIDDQWFVERAAAIRDGDWLGRFDTYTLIKQPGYPLFVAAVDVIGVPLLLAQQLAYAAAAGVLVVALARLLPGWRRVAVFALVLFDPVTMNTSVSARVDRSLVYGALLLLLVAGLVALVDHAGTPSRRVGVWSAGSAVVTAATWLLREEFLLVLPAVALALVVAAVRALRSGAAPAVRAATVGALLLVPAAAVAADATLRAVNDAQYGLAVHNIEQTSVPEALGPMFRVAPVTAFDRYPVTAETRTLLYEVSPQLADLRPEIEGGGSRRFVTTRPDGVDDLNGAVFQWVLLDAIHATGGARTASELDALLRSIGAEIDAACDDGRLECGPPHVGIAPPFEWDRLPALGRRTVYAAWRAALIAPFDATPPAGDATGADRALFARMTGEPLAPGGGVLTDLRAGAIRLIRWMYLALTAAGAVVAAARLLAGARRRRRPDVLTASLVIVGGGVVAARLAGLAYLDLTAFQALSPSYLAPAHVVAAAVIAVLAVGQPWSVATMPTSGGTDPDSTLDQAA